MSLNFWEKKRCCSSSAALMLTKKASSRRLATALLEFVGQESRKLKKGQRVPGHTEILESLLGKYKQIQGRHSQGGMTASLLNIGAVVTPLTGVSST